jgi:hypothetical protein
MRRKRISMIFIIFNCLLFRAITEDLELTISNSTINVPAVTTVVTRISHEISRTYEPYCWRHSYSRGIGHPLHTCPDHSPEQDGLLCYPPCRSGYNGVGPICWEECENMTSIGFACLDLHLSEHSCPDNHAKFGYLCGRFHLRYNYVRSIGSPLICSNPYEQSGAFCYEKCNKKYHGVGPVCWQDCPTTHPYSCLAGCSRTKEICQRKVIGMVQSVIGSSINILNFIIAIPLVILKTFDVLLNAVKGDWISLENDMSMLGGELADKVLPDLAKKFLYWSFGTIESITKNASLELTTTAMKDEHVLFSFLKFFRFDSIDIAFNSNKCEFLN